MTYIVIILVVLGISFGIVPFWFTWRFRRYVSDRMGRPLGNYTPPATVIVPCKGTDLEFRQNIESILDQDYPNFEVLFVTASEDDPAYAELADILLSRPLVNTKLLVAGTSDRRAQKLTNVLYAGGHASKDSQVLVHLDADIRLHRNFFRFLIGPLVDPSVGATAGFPFYMPRRGNPGSVLRSIWGVGALPLLVDTRHNLASGAANALHKDTYAQAGVAQAMDGSASDTFAITYSVKKIGRRVEFVPQCLFLSPDESSIIDTIRWTNRQTVISHVNAPVFWWTVFLTYSFMNFLTLTGAVILVAGIVEGDFWTTTTGGLILSLIPLQILNAWFLFNTIPTVLTEHATRLSQMRWLYLLLAPLGSILIFINSLYSLTTNEISWRGIRYRLISPTQTEVLSRE